VIRSSRGKTDIAGACDFRYVNKAHYVVIDHGENVSSLYLHLSEVNVSVGDTISQGQIIGKSGNTGWVCGPHLHFSFQKTNTIGNYAGESIGFGFIETGKGVPQYRVSYTSQNPVLPSVATIVSKATGKALDAGGANGNQIYPHPSPNPNNIYHRWKLEKVGDFYLIISMATGKALDAGGENGNQIYPHPSPNPSNVYHLWKLEKVGDSYLITNRATGRALDAGGANGNQIYPHPSPNPGNIFHLWKIN
jgi:murein DD-endopeptidase MepM/ murein hydrolase activator NlpD